jgi:hypothetical protein
MLVLKSLDDCVEVLLVFPVLQLFPDECINPNLKFIEDTISYHINDCLLERVEHALIKSSCLMVFSAEKACAISILYNIRYYEGSAQSTKVFNVLLGNGTTHLWLLRLAPVCIGKYSLEILACIPATAFLPEG